ncbi:unnamed protein product, partial [Prorocentrum cordatum]
GRWWTGSSSVGADPSRAAPLLACRPPACGRAPPGLYLGCSRDGPRRLGISRSTFCCNAVLPSLLLLASEGGPRLLLLPLAASIHFLWPSPPAPLRRGTDRRGARDDCLDG